MQVLSDGLMVLGSRLGWIIAPHEQRCHLPRYGEFPGVPFEVSAGIRYGGREILLPLTPHGDTFTFCEQESGPTTLSLSGIDPESTLKLTLTLTIPFWPGDADFSTMPVMLINMTLKRLPLQWRWTRPLPMDSVFPVEVFVAFGGSKITCAASNNGLDISFDTPVFIPKQAPQSGGSITGHDVSRSQQDRVIPLVGTLAGNTFTNTVTQLELDQEVKALQLAWCAFDDPIFEVMGELSPFRYRRHVQSLNDVCKWATLNAARIEKDAARFEALVSAHSLGTTLDHLLWHTFHSWLINTWWVDSPTHGEWYACWEGNCYFHSTIDVEYNQLPFYLAVWPALVPMLLNEWAYFGQDGAALLGERGKGTVFLSHDMGAGIKGNGQVYPHNMEIEENANYLLIALAYWRRTGDDAPLKANRELIAKLLDFLIAADTNGNGVPDEGVSNTIDDACPAVQFAREQVYLGVKTHAALLAGSLILEHVGDPTARYHEQAAKLLDTLNAEGWRDDHFLVCLPSAVDGAFNTWTGQPVTEAEMADWDAPHIYTSNGLVLLDMIGIEHPLDPDKVGQDLHTARDATLTRYGCRHLARDDNAVWIAMNVWRDIAAAYRGIDFLDDLNRYWEWQTTTNAQDTRLFIETAYGNQLSFYPRGVAVWGLFDAVSGFREDRTTGLRSFAPLRANLTVPMLTLADWPSGSVPTLTVTGGQLQLREQVKAG
jgi:xylan 1,4-beta-xylosidase